MKPTGRTPYEIRLELLQLSFEILKNNHRALAVTNTKMSVSTDPLIATSTSTEDVIAEAEKMNGFISKDDRS